MSLVLWEIHCPTCTYILIGYTSCGHPGSHGYTHAPVLPRNYCVAFIVFIPALIALHGPAWANYFQLINPRPPPIWLLYNFHTIPVLLIAYIFHECPQI